MEEYRWMAGMDGWRAWMGVVAGMRASGWPHSARAGVERRKAQCASDEAAPHCTPTRASSCVDHAAGAAVQRILHRHVTPKRDIESITNVA